MNKKQYAQNVFNIAKILTSVDVVHGRTYEEKYALSGLKKDLAAVRTTLVSMGVDADKMVLEHRCNEYGVLNVLSTINKSYKIDKNNTVMPYQKLLQDIALQHARLRAFEWLNDFGGGTHIKKAEAEYILRSRKQYIK